MAKLRPVVGRLRPTEQLRLGASEGSGGPGGVEEKVRIARESFASAETITAVAERHGIPRNRLSSWRTQLRRGQLVAPSSAQAQPDGGFAAVEVEAAASAVIEGRGVTVRLEGATDPAGIAAIAVALAGHR